MDTTHTYHPSDATLYLYTPGGAPEVLVTPEETEDGYRLRSNNRLMWTHDGDRLFYGVSLAEMVALDETKEETESPPVLRSEEHTSELQSRGQLVCRLLHENKTDQLTSIASTTNET